MNNLIGADVAAELIQCHPNTIRRLYRSGMLAGVPVSRGIRFKQRDVVQLALTYRPRRNGLPWRRCTKCNVVKNREDFPKAGPSYSSMCTPCYNTYQRDYKKARYYA